MYLRRRTRSRAAVDAAKFPEGLPALISYVHARGLLWGHYTDAGTHACNGDAPMSEGYERQDAALFASWNVSMLKVDACSVNETSRAIMSRWASLLNATGVPILLSNCRNGCLSDAWEPWCADLTNMWRTSKDIQATFASMVANLDTLRGRGSFARPGAFNDPDFLEIGIGEFAWAADGSTLDMNAAHFALWCVTSAPLILGFDLRPEAAPPAALMSLISNKLALRVNDEYAGNAGDFLRSGDNAGTEIWAKPLLHGAAAAGLVNRAAGAPARISVDFSELPGLLPANATSCLVARVWSGQVSRVDVQFAATVNFRGAEFIVVSNCTR